MKDADTDFMAIKPELLDKFLSLSSTSEQLAFQEQEDVKSAVFCDVHSHDFIENMMHAAIDYHFLHPTYENGHFYKTEAIQKTVDAMQAIDWAEFDKVAKKQIAEADIDADWFGIECYPEVQKLFEYALENGLYVVSFCDISNMVDFEEFEAQFE